MSRYLTIDIDGKQVYEHRLVAELILGRPLRANEHVHHINGNKKDNSPENLEVLDVKEHRRRYRQTHCKRGHELVGENVYTRPDNGFRQCRVCIHERSVAYAVKKREARHARGLLRQRRG